jgi:hypothetical protein
MRQRAQLFHILLAVAPGPHDPKAGPDYDFVAPLDPEGKIDVSTWKVARALCFVQRRDGGTTRHGLLVHRPGGVTGATWAFDYEPGSGDEETGYRFETHAFAPGAFVSVHDIYGQMRTYRVISVKPA